MFPTLHKKPNEIVDRPIRVHNTKAHMRLLVISNSCLSEEESNGRILRTLLAGFTNDELSNFALRGIPNCPGVDYMTVTDHDALRSFISLGIKKPKGIVINSNEQTQSVDHSKSQKAFNHCVRDVIWFSNAWKRGHVKTWIKNLDVSAVFLMAADAPFLYRLARKISKAKQIPLFIYSSEDYFLKHYNYMERKTSMNLWCRLFLNKLHKEARKAFLHASCSLLCSKKLQNSVKSVYGDIPTEVVYQPSLITPIKKEAGPIHKIVYGGNLNSERIVPLLEIAEVIHKANPKLVLDLYGKCADEETKTKIESCPAVSYHGLVPYQELMDVYSKADLLIHAESFSDYNLLDYAHAFSTKIGDCYISGIPFFQYGPSAIPCIQFGMEACPSFTATSQKELEAKLTDILNGKAHYELDRNYIRECFDAKLVGAHIRHLIENTNKA